MSKTKKNNKSKTKGKKTTKKNRKSKKSYNTEPTKRNGTYFFEDFPDFRPNLSPRKVFELGSFGGTYWRPIYSGVLKKNLKNQHKKYPDSWWEGIPNDHLTSSECDIKKNKYGVRVGTSLQFWEDKGWITKYHPYGWFQWYCNFYMGKRSPDDERQVGRWKSLAGPNGRFRKFLINLIKKKSRGNTAKGLKDYTISPKIRQVLQHWGYVLTSKDMK